MLQRAIQPKQNIYEQKKKKKRKVCTAVREKGSVFFFAIFCWKAIPTLSSITILLSPQPEPVPGEVSVNKVDLFNTITVAFCRHLKLF